MPGDDPMSGWCDECSNIRPYHPGVYKCVICRREFVASDLLEARGIEVIEDQGEAEQLHNAKRND